jgi:hypothetical protein
LLEAADFGLPDPLARLAIFLEGDDAAMQAFFEGGSDDDNRRFGWRR